MGEKNKYAPRKKHKTVELTEDEKKFVLENYEIMSGNKISRILCRSSRLVYGFLNENGLHMPEKRKQLGNRIDKKNTDGLFHWLPGENALI